MNTPTYAKLIFGPLTPDQQAKVLAAADLLQDAGIYFDRGTDLDTECVEWEIDWSVRGPFKMRLRDAEGKFLETPEG